MNRPLFYLRFTFLASITLLVVLSLGSYRQLVALIDYSQEVDHTYQVILKTEQILSLTKDAETGQRGFLLTHRREFLEPYELATRKLGRTVAELSDLTQDNARQQRRVEALMGVTMKRMAALNLVIINDTTRQRQPFDRVQELIQGKDLMDGVRLLADSILTEEHNLMNTRQEKQAYSAQWTPKYVLVVSALALILLLISFLLVNRELRRRLAVQQELEQKVVALNRSNAELEQFAYVASHDLQEPLRKIRAFGDRLLLKYGDHLSTDAKGLLEKIESSAARMQVLIDDLLDFSRLVNRKGELVATNLDAVLRDVLGDLTESIKSKNADLQVVGRLPTIQAHPTQMRQLFQNLLANSLKFAKDHALPLIRVTAEVVPGSELRERIQEARSESYHQITVRDNGIGFDPQYAEKIFVIFQRLHGKAEFGGTGIGLAICKRVVANHHGFIIADSAPGEGATFRIYLPASDRVPG